MIAVELHLFWPEDCQSCFWPCDTHPKSRTGPAKCSDKFPLPQLLTAWQFERWTSEVPRVRKSLKSPYHWSEVVVVPEAGRSQSWHQIPGATCYQLWDLWFLGPPQKGATTPQLGTSRHRDKPRPPRLPKRAEHPQNSSKAPEGPCLSSVESTLWLTYRKSSCTANTKYIHKPCASVTLQLSVVAPSQHEQRPLVLSQLPAPLQFPGQSKLSQKIPPGQFGQFASSLLTSVDLLQRNSFTNSVNWVL